MNRFFSHIALAWCCAFLPGVTALALQDPVAESPRTPNEKEEEEASAQANEGLWPSTRLVKLMLTRWTREAAEKYGLDERQRAVAEETVVSRWTKFLDENRKEAQPLLNEFLEMRMELEPPSKERVQEWAKKAKPHFDSARKQFEDGTTEFREILRPSQRVKFEIDAVKLQLGLGLATQKFEQWEKGEFEPDDFWEPLGLDPQARRERGRKRRQDREDRIASMEQGSRDQIELEIDSWQRWVADFILTYGLDSGQKTAVLSCLTELRDRAISHRDRYREDIARLESRIASNSGSEEELADIKTQLDKLYGPIDDMFKELQARALQVPTADQKVQAESARRKPDEKRVNPKPASPAEPVKTNTPAAIEERTTPASTPSPTPTPP